MVYTLTNMSNSGRAAWAAQHPDTTVVGFGRSKLRAIRHLEAGRIDRRNLLRSMNIPTDDANGEFPAFWRVPA